MIAFEGVTFSYRTARVLSGFDFSCKPGEFVALLGPSGCGKTTILKLGAGLLRPAAGRVLATVRPVASIPPRERSIGFVFQSFALFPNLTVSGNVAFGLRYSAIPRSEHKKIVDGLLERLGLSELADRKPRHLSGGQAQRVALARALAPRPKLLFLDEPFSNLDRHVAEEARQLVRELQHEKAMTTILVTHDREHALHLGERIVVLSTTADVLQDASPDEVYSRPASPLSAKLTGPAVTIRGNADSVSGETVSLRYGQSTLRGHCFRGLRPRVGGNVVAIARPESLRLSTTETIQSFECRIADRRPIGTQVILGCRSDVGDYIEVSVPVQDYNRLDGAQRCQLSVDPDQLLCFSEDDNNVSHH